MKITKRTNEYRTIDIFVEKDNKKLSIIFAGTGDLHWMLKDFNETSEEPTYLSFLIDKENYALYESFENLYNDIKDMRVFKEITIPPYIETDEEIIEYLKEKEEDKIYTKKHNVSNYNELFNEEKQTITWFSDETAHDVANIVTIKKLDEQFLLEFYTQPYIEGYERESNIKGQICIRFRNSGSRYDPYNIIFMRMYNELQEIDNTYDENHQYHIEEYIYQKKTTH